MKNVFIGVQIFCFLNYSLFMIKKTITKTKKSEEKDLKNWYFELPPKREHLFEKIEKT